jgi:hypothetical protein
MEAFWNKFLQHPAPWKNMVSDWGSRYAQPSLATGPGLLTVTPSTDVVPEGSGWARTLPVPESWSRSHRAGMALGESCPLQSVSPVVGESWVLQDDARVERIRWT